MDPYAGRFLVAIAISLFAVSQAMPVLVVAGDSPLAQPDSIAALLATTLLIGVGVPGDVEREVVCRG